MKVISEPPYLQKSFIRTFTPPICLNIRWTRNEKARGYIKKSINLPKGLKAILGVKYLKYSETALAFDTTVWNQMKPILGHFNKILNDLN